MTEGYNASGDCPFLARYILRTMLQPLQLSNLCQKTSIRQLGMSRRTNYTNTETESESEARPEVKV